MAGLLAGMLLTSCSATGYQIRDLAGEINATLNTARSVVEVGDTVMVSFPFRPELNHSARVRPDGYATFYLIDEVKVTGMTVESLDNYLTLRFRKHRNEEDIELTAEIVSSPGTAADNSNAVFVVGDVSTPGPIQLTGQPLTLFEAIGAAGGHLKRTANLSNTILVRRIGKTNQTRSWRLDADIYDWGDQPAIFLQARDIVFVPNTAIDDLDIWVDQYIRQLLPFPFLPVQ